MTYAVIEDKSGYLNNSFILELACKKLNLTAEAIEAKVGRYVKGKRLGELKGSLHWSKCVSGGWKKDFGVIYPNSTFGYYIADYNGNVLFGSDKEHHHLADLSHERWLKNPSAQRQHQEYLADCEAYQQKQIEDKQKLLDTAYSLNERYGTEFNDCVTWNEIYSFLDTLTETTQQVKEVRTMTKAAIWNQLKTEYEYSSSFLNKLYGVTYQQASKELLESILEQLQKEVGTGVTDSLGEVDGGSLQPNNLITDTNASEIPVNYIVTLTDYPQVVIKDDYNPKELTEVTEQQLVDSLYTDKVTAELMFSGSYYQVLEVNPENIRQQLMNHYNLEKTSDIVATKTSDNTYYVLVHSQADEVYIESENWLNPKRLIDINDEGLQATVLDSYESLVSRLIRFSIDEYQIAELKSSNLRQGLKDYFANRVLVSNGMLDKAYYLPKELAHEQGYYFKGIPIEHVTKYDIGLDYPETSNDVLLTKFPNYWLVNKSEDVLQFNSFSNAVKHIKEWLGVKQQQVPSTEESLTPKIELFAKFTEFTYLANCLKYLIERMLDANVENAKQLNKEAIIFQNNVFDSWFCVSEICFNYVVKVPLLTYKTRHQLTTLERKSIYA